MHPTSKMKMLRIGTYYDPPHESSVSPMEHAGFLLGYIKGFTKNFKLVFVLKIIG